MIFAICGMIGADFVSNFRANVHKNSLTGINIVAKNQIKPQIYTKIHQTKTIFSCCFVLFRGLIFILTTN